MCLGRLARKPRCNTLFLCSILQEKRAKHRCEPCASVMLHLRAHLGAWTVPIPSVLSVQVLCGSKKGHRPLFRPKYTKRRFFGDLLGGGAPAHPSQGHRGAARSSAYTYIRIPIINLKNQGVHFVPGVQSVLDHSSIHSPYYSNSIRGPTVLHSTNNSSSTSIRVNLRHP